MSHDPNDVVRIAAGDMVTIEINKQELAAEGITAHVVGESLESSFGSALPMSVELWVHQSDAARARAVVEQSEQDRGKTVIEASETGDPTTI